jgi:3-hydroxyisobutyrate dehydrogenase
MMGGSMAAHLAEVGYELAVFNRTPGRAQEVEELGARVAVSPGDAAASADVVILSLADQNVVDAMLQGPEGVFGHLRPGGYIVDTTTVAPSFARELGERASAAGYHSLDACVFGPPHFARAGELRVMVGGEEDAFRAVGGVLEALGKEVVHFGGHGMGATMKLVLNVLIGVELTVLAEAVVYGERAGLPREKILQIVAGSGASSPIMSYRSSLMGERAFGNPLFKLSLMRKDMMLVLEEAQRLVVPMPVAENAYTSLTAAVQQGLGDLDVSAILAFVERMGGIHDYPWPGEDG